MAVTGAGRGIGREIALAFADAFLVLAARTESALLQTRVLATDRGAHEVLVAPTDVTDQLQVEQLAAAAVAEFGAVKRVLVCNSGIPGPTAPLWEIEPEQWRETMRVNVDGSTCAAGRRCRRCSSVVRFGDRDRRGARPADRLRDRGAGAVARHHRRRGRAAVHRVLAGRPSDQPQEVAAAAVFLASPAAAGITGEDLNVSAGVAMY
ncbi:MAG: SDR family NAD(P)-dependent oxidoreductase [Solirubrobacteraceae bacterium]